MSRLGGGLGTRWVAERMARQWTLLLVTVSGVVLVAGVGLLLEMLTGADSYSPAAWWSRWVISLVSLAVLLYFWQVTRLMDRDLGTLYYVRLLEEWMPDWHKQLVTRIGQRYADERIVTANIWERPDRGVIDIAHRVDDVRQRLVAAFVDDSTDTGFDLAPNLVMPAAVALGYDLHLTSTTRMLEFDPGRKPVVWNPTRCDSHGEDFVEVTVLRRGDNGPQESRAHVRTVLVRAYLTPVAVPIEPRGWSPNVTVDVGAFADHEGTIAPRPVVIDQDGRAPLPTVPAKHGDEPPTSACRVHPYRAAEVLSDAVRRALIDFPSATIYLTGRIPKTVAVVVGYRLSGAPHPHRHGGPPMPVRHPWSRLVVLSPDQEHEDFHGENEHPHLLSYRVHPAQPAPDELRRVIGNDGVWS